jgi:signal recognition particle GTPase
MEIENLKPQKGEEEFLKHFESHHHFEKLRQEQLVTKEKAQKTIEDFIKQLHQEIENLPEIKKEAEVHHQSLKDISHLLAQAVYLSLKEGILEGLKFIATTKNPHLIDAFHDLLTGHFFDTLVKYQKIKLID